MSGEDSHVHGVFGLCLAPAVANDRALAINACFSSKQVLLQQAGRAAYEAWEPLIQADLQVEGAVSCAKL